MIRLQFRLPCYDSRVVPLLLRRAQMANTLSGLARRSACTYAAATLTVWFATGMLTGIGRQADAQTGADRHPATSAHGQHTPTKGGPRPAAGEPANTNGTAKSDSGNSAHDVLSLDSVSPETLKPMKDQEVKVQGMIGDYHKTTNRYEFHMNDGSHVEVIGSYPSSPHTTYILNARVVHEGAQYVLSEIHKERVEGGGASVGGIKVDPLLLAGGLLLAAAVITFVVMTGRSKAIQQKQAVELRIEQERRTSDAARHEVERLRAASSQSAMPGPGGTVVTPPPAGAAQNSKAVTPARTIISIGSIEVTAGPHQGQKFPLQHGETRLGRAIKDGIALDHDGEVSSQHGSLIVTVDSRVLYRDESTNGSVLDGKTVHHQQVEAHSGSLLEIGASTLRITLRASPVASQPERESLQSANAGPLEAHSPVSPGAAPIAQGSRSASTIVMEMPVTSVPAKSASPAPATQATLGAELEALSGPDAGQRFAITRSVMGLGREDQDILLNDESISRKHATLIYRDGQFLLTDQGSTHGTKVNGVSIGTEAHELVDGDQITPGTGQTTLVFHTVHA